MDLLADPTERDTRARERPVGVRQTNALGLLSRLDARVPVFEPCQEPREEEQVIALGLHQLRRRRQLLLRLRPVDLLRLDQLAALLLERVDREREVLLVGALRGNSGGEATGERGGEGPHGTRLSRRQRVRAGKNFGSAVGIQPPRGHRADPDHPAEIGCTGRTWTPRR
jgi:hypothetical protein